MSARAGRALRPGAADEGMKPGEDDEMAARYSDFRRRCAPAEVKKYCSMAGRQRWPSISFKADDGQLRFLRARDAALALHASPSGGRDTRHIAAAEISPLDMPPAFHITSHAYFAVRRCRLLLEPIDDIPL